MVTQSNLVGVEGGGLDDDKRRRQTVTATVSIDPLHGDVGDSACAWTTVNISEVFPGLPTPLTWSFHEAGFELGLHGAYVDLGVLPESALRVAEEPDQRVCAMFRGRPFMNVDRFRLFADLMPGTNGDVMEKQLFGQVRPGIPAHPPNWRRYPIIAAKMPKAVLGMRRRLDQQASQLHSWWRARTAPAVLDAGDTACDTLVDSVGRFNIVFRPHCLAMLIGQGLFEQIVTLCADVGRSELVNDLIGGDLVEVMMLNELWEVSRGTRTLDAFVAEHGFHGPNEGELISRSWREDRSSLNSLLQRYAGMDESSGPAAVLARRHERRRDAEATLLAALGPGRRAAARALLGAAQRVVPYREVGKAAYMHTVDVGRAATRVIGARLVAQGSIAAPDDAFMLTVDELVNAPAHGVRVDIAARRARWQDYARLEYPQLCQGPPTPVEIQPGDDDPDGDDADGPVTGIPVAPGHARGRARVVLDPTESELEPGDVLICRSTDPSWITLFVIASAVVIDIGGPMSHGAIVARELGIPCVINTKVGTRRIVDGSEVEVDGTAGTVTVVAQ